MQKGFLITSPPILWIFDLPLSTMRVCHNYEERMKIFGNRPYCLKFDMLYYGVITSMKGAQCYGISL